MCYQGNKEMFVKLTIKCFSFFYLPWHTYCAPLHHRHTLIYLWKWTGSGIRPWPDTRTHTWPGTGTQTGTRTHVRTSIGPRTWSILLHFISSLRRFLQNKEQQKLVRSIMWLTIIPWLGDPDKEVGRSIVQTLGAGFLRFLFNTMTKGDCDKREELQV